MLKQSIIFMLVLVWRQPEGWRFIFCRKQSRRQQLVYYKIYTTYLFQQLYQQCAIMRQLFNFMSLKISLFRAPSCDIKISLMFLVTLLSHLSNVFFGQRVSSQRILVLSQGETRSANTPPDVKSLRCSEHLARTAHNCPQLMNILIKISFQFPLSYFYMFQVAFGAVTLRRPGQHKNTSKFLFYFIGSHTIEYTLFLI